MAAVGLGRFPGRKAAAIGPLPPARFILSLVLPRAGGSRLTIGQQGMLP